MSEKNDGGPAFPEPMAGNSSDVYGAEGEGLHPGMTLRDYFAAKAMQSIIAHRGSDLETSGRFQDARCAYEIADAMLEERKK